MTISVDNRIAPPYRFMIARGAICCFNDYTSVVMELTREDWKENVQTIPLTLVAQNSKWLTFEFTFTAPVEIGQFHYKLLIQNDEWANGRLLIFND